MPEEIVYLEDEVETFTKDEKSVAAMVLNYLGSNEHPVASSDELRYFGRDYLIECLRKLEDCNFVKDEGKIIGKKLLLKLTAQPQ